MRDGPDIAQLITLINNLNRLSYPLNEKNVLISSKKKGGYGRFWGKQSSHLNLVVITSNKRLALLLLLGEQLHLLKMSRIYVKYALVRHYVRILFESVE